MNVPFSKVKAEIPDWYREEILDDSVFFSGQYYYVGGGTNPKCCCKTTAIDGKFEVTVKAEDKWESKCAAYAWLLKLRDEDLKPEKAKRKAVEVDADYWLDRIKQLQEKEQIALARDKAAGKKSRANERVVFNKTEVLELKESFMRIKEMLEYEN